MWQYHLPVAPGVTFNRASLVALVMCFLSFTTEAVEVLLFTNYMSTPCFT